MVGSGWGWGPSGVPLWAGREVPALVWGGHGPPGVAAFTGFLWVHARAAAGRRSGAGFPPRGGAGVKPGVPGAPG